MTGQILGRADELRQVFAFLADDTPGARAVVLLGEAGIGKTTIWRAGVRHAEELGLRALVAQPAESEAGLPYAALADLFATVTDDALDRLPPQQRAALGAALARTAHAGPLDPHALARATVELLAGAASDGRLLVAIDDVQWLDAPTAAALAFGLRRLESASLLRPGVHADRDRSTARLAARSRELGAASAPDRRRAAGADRARRPPARGTRR